MQYLIGTRGSKLALAQSEQVCACLQKHYPMHTFACKIISTKGDQNQQSALDQMNTKGIFVKEIEEALFRKEIDLAVHSMKDMPSVLPEGLCFTKTILREDPRDVLMTPNQLRLDELPQNARIATGSKRRKAQLLQLRPDLEIVGIRGNIDTRMQKMHDQGLDGIVLAKAGVHRLGLDHLIADVFPIDVMIPACGQGALAIEVRQEDQALLAMINALADDTLDQEVQVERAFLAAVHGGCHAPVGAFCHIHQAQVELYALYGEETCTHMEQVHVTTSIHEITTLAQAVAQQLLERMDGE